MKITPSSERKSPHLPDILSRRANVEGASVAYRFFQNGAADPEEMSFYALWRQAAAMAAGLQALGCANERVLLVCESQKLFVLGFYACLLAGAVAVPTAPPRRAALQGRLDLLARDARAKFMLHDSDGMGAANLDGQAMLRFDLRHWIDAADVDGLASRWTMPVLTDDALAFLQYTSGSTGDPKGVAVSHANVVHNCAAIETAMAITPDAAILTALPLFHDMGLIGGVLQSMVSGCVAHFMSPAEFVQYPERWLSRIARFGITNSGGPNFMYDHAAREIDDSDIEGCHLSAWRLAFCGAEPIRAATVSRFVERFAAYGFHRDSFYPCYGMAESTLFITGKQVGVAPTVTSHLGSEVVGCGAPRLDMQVEIVDPVNLNTVAPGGEGEIWVAGGSVAKGYWNRPELTEEIFKARVAGAAAAATSFLRTGDLGFRKDGQLFVTGRLKDMIILYGKKYAPQDIESVAIASHDALRPDGGAAFSVFKDDTERLVVVFELERSWVRRHAEHPNIVQAIRASITHHHGVHIDDAVLIKPGALPRTSSGKVRRSQCRADYIEGNFPSLAPGAAD